MKSQQFSKFVTLMTAILLTMAAVAAGAAHKGTLQISDPVQVNGKQVPAGIYTVVWDGEGPETNLHIMQGKKEVGAAPCRVVALDRKASNDAAEVRTSDAGRELTAVRFSGQKYQLDLAGETSQEAKSGNAVK